MVLAALVLSGCGGDPLGGFKLPGSNSAQAPSRSDPQPVNMAGRWLFSVTGAGQCHMTFRATSPNAVEGTVAPEGGCPGKFFTSRKWVYDQASLTMQDHKGEPLARLTVVGEQFEGSATSGEPVTLIR
jgi:Protease inhibitor Inh